MTKTIHIHCNTFHAELILDELHRLPLSNWRKLCQILAKRREYHDKEIRRLDIWFPVSIKTAEIDFNLSRAAFDAGCKDARRVAKGKQHEQMLLNEELRRNRNAAARRYENLKKQYDIFKKEITTNGNHDQ